MNSSNLFKSKKNTGFTLLELMVVVSIVSIIFTVLVSKQNTFQERFKVDEKVFNLVLAIRKAQAYTLGVREFHCASNGTRTFNSSYGIHLNINNPDRFLFFLDAVPSPGGNNRYDESGSEPCYTETILLSPPGIDRICGVTTAGFIPGGLKCSPASPIKPGEITITFERPYPKSIMKFISSINSEITTLQDNPLPGLPNSKSAAYIYFKYPSQPGEVEVKIDATGQVSTRYCSITCAP